jgi:transcriptional regulator with XRE-family HTH domain
MMDLPRTIVRLMKKQKLKGTELAARLGVKPPFISQIRSGKRSIPRGSVGAWIKALRLNDEDARKFRLLALFLLSPRELGDVIDGLLEEVGQLQGKKSGKGTIKAALRTRKESERPTTRRTQKKRLA